MTSTKKYSGNRLCVAAGGNVE